MELVGLCPPNSSAFLFVLMSDEKTGAQRQVTFWILKLESGQVQICPEVSLMPVEQALLPPPHSTCPWPPGFSVSSAGLVERVVVCFEANFSKG